MNEQVLRNAVHGSHRCIRRVGILFLGALLVAGARAVDAQSGAAYLVIDLRTGRTIAERQPEAIETPIVPGSVIKILTLIAALESHTIDDTLRVNCPGQILVAGRTYRCSHPRIDRPLGPAEALAHSCNVFFATVARRLPRPVLDSWFVALSLPRPPSAAATVDVALGLGSKATPRALLGALTRVAGVGAPLAIQPSTRRVVLDGLRGAARYGTAASFGARGMDALAKTGTAPMTASRYQGMVVAVTPAINPTRGVVVLAPGAAGLDAADIASGLLQADGPAAIPAAIVTPASAPASGTSVSRDMKIRLGRARRGGGYDVEVVPLEEYVAQILAGEAAAASRPAALDALAITARTFAHANRRRHAGAGFDLCDLTHCQVTRPATAATSQAARRTAGQILLYKGAPAQVFYSASCGGRTEVPSAVWPGATDFPFLGTHDDDSCVEERPWISEIAERDLGRALRAAGFRGSMLRGLVLLGRNASGRVARLRIDGFKPDAISGSSLRLAIGRTLGWHRLKSTSFDVERTASGFRFTGRGAGHGVGLCVIGSARQAAEGLSAETILQRYFPGLALSRPGQGAQLLAKAPAPPVPLRIDAVPASSRVGGVRMTLPALAEEDRDELDGLVDAAQVSVARRLGRPVNGAVTLRFHPTVESFRRSTGQPWWIAASTSGSTIDLLPVSVLRSRGVLESTLRHELAHVATSASLADRPLWVREGAAIYFAGEPYGELSGRVACPRDDEILRAPSPGALRTAYARAGACFARAIQAGKSWNDVE